MIWQEEVKREIRHREWVGFYTGLCVASGIFLLCALAWLELRGPLPPGCL